MQSAKDQQSSRRASMPTTVGSRRPPGSTGSSATGSAASSVKVKPVSQKSVDIPQTSVSSPAPAQSSSSSITVNTTPIILTPVSQLPKGPRRNSRPELTPGDKNVSWDPEQYNPDGSLRTVHRLPGFDQSYAQAMKARYIRHRTVVDREKELTVNQIFDKP